MCICRCLGLTPRSTDWEPLDHIVKLLSDFRNRNGVERASAGQQERGLREIGGEVTTKAS